MPKTILITGSTDGIGLATAKSLVADGHHVLLHGRNQNKLDQVADMLTGLPGAGKVESYLADLSDLQAVRTLAQSVINQHDKLDVLINNAGVLKVADAKTRDGLDVRFAVNTIAPYLLTQLLLPIIDSSGRIINLSSAAQAPVNLEAMVKFMLMDDMAAYSQSKLAITMWSFAMAEKLGDAGPTVVAINPGSLLATKMVKEGFGFAGHDVHIGSDLLVRAALNDEFASASGRYFDNDAGRFANPQQEALDPVKNAEIVRVIEAYLAHR
ncbi:MAG: SDR family NAD(P)-dependent oxidoreductase [Gammaproteobacteria bacterium]|nr:SDR family NAD(P)-dependent oxidoreductase [Gammaproteobacteria bacterium]